MDIVPSLWVSTYYCILGWHLVITKKQKKNLFINFVISRHQLQFDYYIVRDVLKNFPQNFFFSCGRTVTKQTLRHLWRVIMATLIGRTANIANIITHPTPCLTAHKKKSAGTELRGNCLTVEFSYSQASMEDTCHSRCLLLHFFI